MKNYKIGEKYLIKHRTRGLYGDEYAAASVGVCVDASPRYITLKINNHTTRVIYFGDIIEEGKRNENDFCSV